MDIASMAIVNARNRNTKHIRAKNQISVIKISRHIFIEIRHNLFYYDITEDYVFSTYYHGVGISKYVY